MSHYYSDHASPCQLPNLPASFLSLLFPLFAIAIAINTCTASSPLFPHSHLSYSSTICSPFLQERLSRVSSAVSWALEQHLPSRGRALAIQGLQVVRVGGGVTLIEEREGSMTSLEDVYLSSCSVRHENPYWLQSASHRHLLNGGKEAEADSTGGTTHDDRARKAYSEACCLVPPTVLRQQFNSACRSLCDTFTARRDFASQLGVNAAVQYLLCAPALSPDQMLLCCRTGAMVSVGVTPKYKGAAAAQVCADDPYTRLDRNEDLPFRMTRNIVGALSGAMVLGATTVSLGLSLDACVGSKDILEASLSMLLCEDLRARNALAGALSVVSVKVICVIYHRANDSVTFFFRPSHYSHLSLWISTAYPVFFRPSLFFRFFSAPPLPFSSLPFLPYTFPSLPFVPSPSPNLRCDLILSNFSLLFSSRLFSSLLFSSLLFSSLLFSSLLDSSLLLYSAFYPFYFSSVPFQFL